MLKEWASKADVETGKRAGLPSNLTGKMKALEREIRENASGKRDSTQGLAALEAERLRCRALHRRSAHHSDEAAGDHSRQARQHDDQRQDGVVPARLCQLPVPCVQTEYAFFGPFRFYLCGPPGGGRCMWHF